MGEKVRWNMYKRPKKRSESVWEVFSEKEGIAAIQFNSLGMMGLNQYHWWLREDLDTSSKLKLVGIFMALINHSLKNTIY